jgi:phage gpG-like protein
MSSNIQMFDNRIQVKTAMSSKITSVLEECIGEIESQVIRNTAVDTGKTKGSWNHKVMADTTGYVAVVGSNYENAIWEEFGTGNYALNGDGRKGGWSYKDVKGNWHHTYGKRPRRPFFNAYNALKDKIINRIQQEFRE